jgi:RNA polymerase sigma-70 factor (family 1)
MSQSAARRRDGEAMEAIFRAHWKPLTRHALRFLRCEDEAEDAVQSVFVRMWRNETEWPSNEAMSSYLHSAVRNASLDRARRLAVRREFRERRAAVLLAEPIAPHGHGNADADLSVADLASAAERAISELPPKRRQVYLLRVEQELSYAQIAERLGIATKTVENHLASAYKHFRLRLSEYQS